MVVRLLQQLQADRIIHATHRRRSLMETDQLIPLMGTKRTLTSFAAGLLWPASIVGIERFDATVLSRPAIRAHGCSASVSLSLIHI